MTDLDRFRPLTDGQRDCLRLVAKHFSSKQIARELGIAKDTVDQRLDRARRLLGASDRFAAARALAEFEASYHRVVYDPAPLASSTPQAASERIDDQRGLRATGGVSLREMPATYVASSSKKPRRFRLPLAVNQGERNDLTTIERLGWIALIAVAVPVLLGSLIGGLWALGEIAQAVARNLS